MELVRLFVKVKTFISNSKFYIMPSSWDCVLALSKILNKSIKDQKVNKYLLILFKRRVEYFSNFRVGRIFLNKKWVPKTIKGKTGCFDHLKIKNVCMGKAPINICDKNNHEEILSISPSIFLFHLCLSPLSSEYVSMYICMNPCIYLIDIWALTK